MSINWNSLIIFYLVDIACITSWRWSFLIGRGAAVVRDGNLSPVWSADEVSDVREASQSSHFFYLFQCHVSDT